ncbi:helicase-related protein [Arthrobacter crystallopoietes]|uniref:helicase-related protein n=1 Tax=Crystallibacter crystallopoietes TaxID=37928 RepID=UPI003D19BD75
METLDSKYSFRSEMVDRLKTDLFGPGSKDEVINERPLERYVNGILWPAADESVEEVPDDPESVAAANGEAAPDSPVANARLAFPSSIGLTVAVDLSQANELIVRPRAARYEPVEKDALETGKRMPSPDWRRVELEELPITVPLETGASTRKVDVGLELYTLVRPPQDGVTSVTVVLRNRKLKPPAGTDRDIACWFQVGLTVEGLDFSLTDRSKLRTTVSNDADLASAELIYRKHMVFAAGHGCAVIVDDKDVDEARCRRVSTTFIPTVNVHRSKAGSSAGNLRLGFLGSAPREEVLQQLEALASDYEGWIRSMTASIDAPDSDVAGHLRKVAQGHMDDAGKALSRIRNGIQTLRESDEAFEAFQLANQAMHMQRSRQDWVRSGRAKDFGLEDKQAWRPFQLAFILINLPSVTDENHNERDIADLLWFPTGGGKTEAYLGLIAYLILLRRLRDPGAEGVAVIMRYTLRLLTIQQFERAAMLICSLEYVRSAIDGRLGKEAFGIGLWVGSGATPNNIKDAKANLNKLMRGDNVVEGNPCQIEACPWCGSRLRPENYIIFRAPTDQMKVLCPNNECDFREGLPVHIVDTDVYRERPELVIGTVDKFARMAWNGEISTMFGRLDKTDHGPDLIIQDELHLISGPLGSTVGLFETAVDLAAGGRLRIDGSSNGQRRPKIIASTATIRRAGDQILSVFNRKSELFPPPGLSPDDSFFSEKAPADELGTRQYVGVMAAGTSHATLMVRTYASLLHSAMVVEATDEDRDPYWTLIGYFNSLRVLGSAYLQVYDDVAARLRLLAHREGRENEREVQLSELTSRVANNLIPAALKSLEKPFGGDLTPEDVVLATNMISVGLDVDRLGLMTVMGQPQSSAEYIQATSRVGRKHPGLVVTIFNSAKTRDRSHFEGFTDYHGALYRAVEATSATPFAARSRDRALHAMFVSALRMVTPELRSNADASGARDASTVIDQVRDVILNRVRNVDERELAATRNELEILLTTWRTAINNNEQLVYDNRKNPQGALLVNATDALDDPEFIYSTASVPWPTPSSMRDVDAETTLRPCPMRKTATESGFKRKDGN